MNKWKPAKLGDIAETCLGKMLDKEKNKGVLQPYIANVNLRWGGFDLTNLSTMRFEESESERYGLKPGDLVVCEGGEPGRCAIWRGEIPEMKIQKAIHRVRTNKDYSNEFLFYRFLLAGRNGELKKHFIGSTIKHLTGFSLKQVEFDFPSLSEQQDIAKVLTALDAKIELNNRINVELEGMAKLLYDYWFVQYDFPMTAAQAAALGKPKLAGHPYRASGGKMVWSQELKREVPEDWRVGNLGELCDIFDGPHATPTKTESGPYYLSISSLENGRLDLAKSARISEAEFVKWTRRATPTAGDVLFSYETRLGEAALMPAEIRACLGRRMGLLRPKRDQVSTAFLLQSYLSQAFQGVIRANVIQGATVERILLNDLPSFPMLIPALEQRDAASKILTPLHGKIAQNQRQTQELTALRDWLLPMLMNGQVTVG
jgi:type I restriction enzyme S subunit